MYIEGTNKSFGIWIGEDNITMDFKVPEIILHEFIQVWTSLDEFARVWTSLDKKWNVWKNEEKKKISNIIGNMTVPKLY